MGTKQHHDHGLRRRFGGVTGIRHKVRGGFIVVPRHHEKVTTPSKVSFECGQDKPYPTKAVPGEFKVQMPRNHRTFVRQPA